MFEKLIEYVVKRKEELQKKLKEIDNSLRDINPYDYWKEYTPKSHEKKKVLAEDGSVNYIEYKKYLVYAVSAEAVFFDGNNIHTETNLDVDILIPYKFTRDRLRFYMSILEKKAVLKMLANGVNPDYILLDGSIIGDIIRPAAYAHRPSVSVKEKLRDEFLGVIKRSLDSNKFSTVFSKELYSDVVNVLGTDDPEELTPALIYLEYLENLLTLSKLLNHSDKVIAISKRSTGNHYFKMTVPDMAIFERFCQSPGFSYEPFRVRDLIKKKYKIAFPILEQLFRNTKISFFYVRFNKKATVLRMEVVSDLVDDVKIKRILDDLEGYVVEGYPYLLTRAHRDVKISRKDMFEIAKAIGLGYLERTGREML
ncbi:MAG: DNA double-strand break repair nuclease NurA [Candidatus Asgardarchaeia archaeon]